MARKRQSKRKSLSLKIKKNPMIRLKLLNQQIAIANVNHPHRDKYWKEQLKNSKSLPVGSHCISDGDRRLMLFMTLGSM